MKFYALVEKDFSLSHYDIYCKASTTQGLEEKIRIFYWNKRNMMSKENAEKFTFQDFIKDYKRVVIRIEEI